MGEIPEAVAQDLKDFLALHNRALSAGALLTFHLLGSWFPDVVVQRR